MSLVKSKQRVADHGEVFTPAWIVEAMLDLVKDETSELIRAFWSRRAATATSLCKFCGAN